MIDHIPLLILVLATSLTAGAAGAMVVTMPYRLSGGSPRPSQPRRVVMSAPAGRGQFSRVPAVCIGGPMDGWEFDHDIIDGPTITFRDDEHPGHPLHTYRWRAAPLTTSRLEFVHARSHTPTPKT